MSIVNNEKAPLPASACDCYKKLEQFGIPLYIADENEFYTECANAITYETAFKLPGELTINENINEYLRVGDNELSAVFEHMAEVFPALADHEINILSFWILDVLIEGLWTAQNSKMDFDHQKATLLWIAYFINYIQKENPTREQLFYHLKVILFQSDSKAANEEHGEILKAQPEGGKDFLKKSTETLSDTNATIVTHWSLPLPPNIVEPKKKLRKGNQSEINSMDYESEEETFSTFVSENSMHSEENCSHMKIILEILYRIFARNYLGHQIQSLFNMMPSLEVVNLPFTLHTPKPLNRAADSGGSKTDKIGKKLSLSDKSSEELESERQLHKHDYILPLEAAEEAKEFMYKHQTGGYRNKEDKNKK